MLVSVREVPQGSLADSILGAPCENKGSRRYCKTCLLNRLCDGLRTLLCAEYAGSAKRGGIAKNITPFGNPSQDPQVIGVESSNVGFRFRLNHASTSSVDEPRTMKYT